MMAGHLGQYVYVNPDTRAVVVRLGQSRGGLSSEQGIPTQKGEASILL
jgi:CubicO group peptidase (beta-lactamase class C family)